jgi:hypothetical protein
MIAVGLKILGGTIFWEAQFQIVRWICSGLPTKTDKERSFKKCVPSYVVSYVHAFFLSWAGFRIGRVGTPRCHSHSSGVRLVTYGPYCPSSTGVVSHTPY